MATSRKFPTKRSQKFVVPGFEPRSSQPRHSGQTLVLVPLSGTLPKNFSRGSKFSKTQLGVVYTQPNRKKNFGQCPGFAP